MREYLDWLPRPIKLKLSPGLPMVRPHSRSVSFMNICMLQEQSLQYCLLPLHTTKIMLPRNQPWIYLPPWMDCTLNNWVERVLLSCWPRLMRSSQRCLAVRNKQLMLKNLQENKEILKFGQKWELEESLPAIFTKYAILTCQAFTQSDQADLLWLQFSICCHRLGDSTRNIAQILATV